MVKKEACLLDKLAYKEADKAASYTKAEACIAEANEDIKRSIYMNLYSKVKNKLQQVHNNFRSNQ